MVCAMKVNIRDTLRPLSFVAMTTDCWSAHRRSYIGVTVHWIDPESLERKWAALACRRLRGSHTFDVLAAALEDINTEFGISQKICRTTTDSGSNFVKAFSVFGNKPDADTATDIDTCIESGIEFEDAGRVLETDEFVEYRLPSHHQCACHSLNLVSTTDAHPAEESPAYKRLSRAAFAKCQALWNKAGRSALAAEAVQDTCGVMLVKPNATCWNSVFLAVSRIVRIKREKGEEALYLMCNDLDLPRLKPAEMSFLEDYCATMKPVAQALNILQSETKAYMGYLLPTITLLEEKLRKRGELATSCQPLVNALLAGIDKWFYVMKADKKFIAVAILLPTFMNDWSIAPASMDCGLQYIRERLTEVNDPPAGRLHCDSTPDSDDDDDLFFAKKKRRVAIPEQLDHYLAADCDSLSTLKSWPQLQSLFVQFNTPLPASAACERLFSVAGLIFRPLRASIGDATFEHQLLLNLNRSYI